MVMQHDFHILHYLRYIRDRDYGLFIDKLWSHLDYHYHEPLPLQVEYIDG